MKPVTQEDPMGCAIACTAYAINKSYKKAKSLFDNPSYANSRGYYCRDIIKVLNKSKLNYKFSKFSPLYGKFLSQRGTIVFIKRSKKYPAGHYLIKTAKGWMNPWINFPSIAPAKSGFQYNLPGEAQWIIYQQKT